MSVQAGRERGFLEQLTDFANGVVGGVSDLRSAVRHVRLADNVLMRPRREMSVRPGSRNISSGNLPYEPNSIGEYIPSSGTSRIFVAANTYDLLGGILEAKPTSYAPQILPFVGSSRDWSFQQLNYTIFATQRGGTEKPVMYRAEAPANPANTWHSMVLPKPPSSPTFSADTAGGSLTTATAYYWRFRWRYRDGSSLAGPVVTRTPTSPNLTVNFATNVVPASPRSDYLGWTMERTKAGGTTNGPFYFVQDGTSATPSDGTADTDLFAQTDEGIHGEPPHMDGLTSFKDRLVGWIGTSVMLSQIPSDEEATGPCNWDTDLVYPVGRDDGEAIVTCLVSADRLIILKTRSAWALTGDNPDSFQVFKVSEGYGCVGPRAACVVGSAIYAYGQRGLWRMAGYNPEVVGRMEVSHYLDLSNPANEDALFFNFLGDLACLAYPVAAVSRNDEQLVYDIEFKNWTHFVGWNMRDAIMHRGNAFPTVNLIFCDNRNRASFAGVTATEAISGTGIQGGSTVSTVVSATRITISLPATLDQTGVTLTIGGDAYPNCITRNNSTTVVVGDFRLWSAFDGAKDERASDSSGGIVKKVRVRTPTLDNGFPDMKKIVRRVGAIFDGDISSLSATFVSDETSSPVAVTFNTIPVATSVWAVPNWGAFSWSSSVFVLDALGLPDSAQASRYSIEISFDAESIPRFSGITIEGSILTTRRYS